MENRSLHDPITIFRVDNVDSNRGLWYTTSGTYVGEVMNDFTQCRASNLAMPHDPILSGGWRSGTKTLQELLHWFNLEEMEYLQKEGFYVSIYSSRQCKEYLHHIAGTDVKVPHMIFKDSDSELVRLIDADEFRKMLRV